jgi:hypothetical protein
MTRRIAVLVCVLAATGCARLQDMDSDAFTKDGVSQESIQTDSQACTAQADLQRSYEIRGIGAENADRHRIFNRAYEACMKAKGYRENTGMLNFWQAYDL